MRATLEAQLTDLLELQDAALNAGDEAEAVRLGEAVETLCDQLDTLAE